jgi:hypothetical protein
MKFTKEQKAYLLDKVRGIEYTDVYLTLSSLPEGEFQKHKINTILYTKDGGKVGNAIIQEALAVPSGDVAYQIKTDYGNKMMLTEAELYEYFRIGGVAEKDHKHFTK